MACSQTRFGLGQLTAKAGVDEIFEITSPHGQKNMFNLGHSCSTAPATQITLWEAHAREALDLFALHIPSETQRAFRGWHPCEGGRLLPFTFWWELWVSCLVAASFSHSTDSRRDDEHLACSPCRWHCGQSRATFRAYTMSA